MKIRQLKANSSIYAMLENIPVKDHPLSILKRATQVTEEEFIAWIYDLRANHADYFSQLADEIVHGMDSNIVFRKPAIKSST